MIGRLESGLATGSESSRSINLSGNRRGLRSSSRARVSLPYMRRIGRLGRAALLRTGPVGTHRTEQWGKSQPQWVSGGIVGNRGVSTVSYHAGVLVAPG